MRVVILLRTNAVMPFKLTITTSGMFFTLTMPDMGGTVAVPLAMMFIRVLLPVALLITMRTAALIT